MGSTASCCIPQDITYDCLGAQVAQAPRPKGAVGTFLRLITINDVYKLDNYPYVAGAVSAARHAAPMLDCVVTSHLNGDFLSPCMISAVDGGTVMMDALNRAKIEYACLGNHEFDMGTEPLRSRLPVFKGQLINSNAEVKGETSLPTYNSLKIGDKTVLLGGFLTDNMSAVKDLTVKPVTESCIKLWEEAKVQLGLTPDLFLPMTHQLIEEDVQTAVALNKHPELARCTPVILGGHDHGVHAEEVGQTRILKTGQDAENIGIVDIWWTEQGSVQSSYTLLPAIHFPKDAEACSWAQETADFYRRMMDVPILTLSAPTSTKFARHFPVELVTTLCSLIKTALRPQGVDMVMLHGAGIRGNTDYEAGKFYLKDLYRELPFECAQAVVEVKGQLLADTILCMNSKPGDKKGFLHVDSDAEVSKDFELVRINGDELLPDKLYTVATDVKVLTGAANVQPLLSEVKAGRVTVPDDDHCVPGKQLVVQTCMMNAWRDLIRFDEWDANHDGIISPEELAVGVSKLMKDIDRNGDGTVDIKELEDFLVSKGSDLRGLVTNFFSMTDKNHDGKISQKEFASLAF